MEKNEVVLKNIHQSLGETLFFFPFHSLVTSA